MKLEIREASLLALFADMARMDPRTHPFDSYRRLGSERDEKGLKRLKPFADALHELAKSLFIAAEPDGCALSVKPEVYDRHFDRGGNPKPCSGEALGIARAFLASTFGKRLPRMRDFRSIAAEARRLTGRQRNLVANLFPLPPWDRPKSSSGGSYASRSSCETEWKPGLMIVGSSFGHFSGYAGYTVEVKRVKETEWDRQEKVLFSASVSERIGEKVEVEVERDVRGTWDKDFNIG